MGKLHTNEKGEERTSTPGVERDEKQNQIEGLRRKQCAHDGEGQKNAKPYKSAGKQSEINKKPLARGRLQWDGKEEGSQESRPIPPSNRIKARRRSNVGRRGMKSGTNLGNVAYDQEENHIGLSHQKRS